MKRSGSLSSGRRSTSSRGIRPATPVGLGLVDALRQPSEGQRRATAAQMLAPLLAARGDRQGARWRSSRPASSEDCSEALSRVAMECGGAVGDAGWVERELRAWEKKMDELFPHSSHRGGLETYRTVMAPFEIFRTG